MVGKFGLFASFALGVWGCGGNKNQVVDASAGGTIPCKTAANCPAELPMCNSANQGMVGGAGVCVGCLPDFQTCGNNMHCDDKTYTCLPVPDGGLPCKQTADCPRPGIDPSSAIACEVDAGMCVGCSTNTDCPVDPNLSAPYVCILSTHACGDPCTLCTGNQVCDVSTCTNDHYCGTANKVCHNPDGG